MEEIIMKKILVLTAAAAMTMALSTTGFGSTRAKSSLYFEWNVATRGMP